ncbi:GGDEF domain-containing protein [Terriglobus saanensis]|uniref:Diguanylate cyclase n=1 Tax=Terriglobus saanensis (strain ATCC BAA-1853 / DSM 23119 / SP1PR4) TaxID=401053 RepID=E8V0R1_TERSS|nr:GGDEF domain-containing protein [Terriglobus saanensis]ADV81124.1 diguanylate cyclase [Terriglobus saanensis SP1PR4]
MVFNPLLLPDLIAMASLTALLFALRRTYNKAGLDGWMAGLFFIFLEIFAHAFYTPHGPWVRTMHAAMLDFYALAGLSFFFSGADRQQSRRRVAYMVLNSLPYLVLLTAYGYEVKNQFFYEALAIVSCLLGLGLVMAVKLRVWNAAVHVVFWAPLWFAAHHHDFRSMAYGSLFFLYAMTAFAFHQNKRVRGLGIWMLVAGFALWALVFLTHPAASTAANRIYATLSNLVWDMQKFLIVIGMLVVLLEEQLKMNETLALHDVLTGLPNRRLFDDRLLQSIQRALRNQKPVALITIDLNGFKKINDTLGHPAGDEILKAVASRLQSTLRATDTVARLGGDEFSIIVTDSLDAEQTRHLLVKIMTAFVTPIQLNTHGLVEVKASVGFALFPADTANMMELQAIADRRMYEHKRFQGVVLAEPQLSEAV